MRGEKWSPRQSERNELFALKKEKIDMEIMKLNLVGMNAIKQDYFQNLQKEIYKVSKSKSSSASSSPSTPFGSV